MTRRDLSQILGKRNSNVKLKDIQRVRVDSTAQKCKKICKSTHSHERKGVIICMDYALRRESGKMDLEEL